MTKLMLGISYIGSNADSAKTTIQSFAHAFASCPNYKVTLGIDTTSEEKARVPGEFQQAFEAVYVWDDKVTQQLQPMLEGTPAPWYPGFSYGGLVNRLLIMSRIPTCDCDYVVRVDPGTLAPADLAAVLARQIEALKTNDVVSGVYADRLAYRDHLYVPRDHPKYQQYLSLIMQATGVNIFSQLTAGALLLMGRRSIPAIPFEQCASGPTLVWGSDDAFLQQEARARVFTEHKVPRHDSVGKSKPPLEYFTGVLGMAYLHGLIHGSARKATISSGFIEKLNEFLDANRPENRDEKGKPLVPLCASTIAPDFLDSVYRGYRNYQKLRLIWNDLSREVARSIPPGFVDLSLS